MFKSKAFIIAAIIAIIGVFVVMASLSVFDNDSAERYGANQQESANSNIKGADTVAAPDVEAESTQPVEKNDVGGLNETTTEHMEEAKEAVPETVVDENETAPEEPMSAAEPAEPAADTATDEAATDATADAAEQPTSGESKIHTVTAEGLKYEPLVVTIQPGDTVAWENMPTHDTQSIEGLIPEGAEAWHSQMGKNYQRTFDVEGIYVYKCTPHFGTGMGGAIIVGKPTNLEQIKAADVKGAAGRLVRKAIAEAEKM